MFVARNVEADHKDLIHDVAYDFYGRRLATCSSDQSVKVWDIGEDGQWHCTASWKCHQASVWKVTWAHPEFGQVLATCSFDRSAGIWEELPADSLSGESNQSHWVRRAFLVDSRTSVTDVKFAPRHLGLLLATCSADGSLRIYEAPDVMTLSQWSVQHEINCKISLSSITWNPSRIHPPMIAVGSDDTSTGGKVILFEFSENTRQWIKIEVISLVSDPVHDIAFAPNVGRSYHLLGIASRDVKILSIKPFDGQLKALAQQSHPTNNANQLTPNQKFEIKQVAQFNEHGAQVWRVSWNITGTILASSGDDGSVRLWKANYLDNWKCVTELKCQNNLSFPGVSSSHDDNRSGGSDGKNAKGHRNFSSLVSPGPMTRH